MGRRTTRRPGRPKTTNRPSFFFMIALAIGVALVLWFFITMIRRPAPKLGSEVTVVSPLRAG